MECRLAAIQAVEAAEYARLTRAGEGHIGSLQGNNVKKMMELTDTSIQELAMSMQSGAMTSKDLVEAFRQVIASDDGSFNAVAFLNPDADMIADTMDRERAEGRVR
ncbi:uncharacterized protein METZ01_LOCUS389031, partial [marine metagenome]